MVSRWKGGLRRPCFPFASPAVPCLLFRTNSNTCLGTSLPSHLMAASWPSSQERQASPRFGSVRWNRSNRGLWLERKALLEHRSGRRIAATLHSLLRANFKRSRAPAAPPKHCAMLPRFKEAFGQAITESFLPLLLLGIFPVAACFR